MDQPHQLEKNCFKKSMFQNKPLHVLKLAFRKLNPSLILDLSCAYILLIPPPWVRLDLLSTFVLTPCLIFTEEDPDFIPEDVE